MTCAYQWDLQRKRISTKYWLCQGKRAFLILTHMGVTVLGGSTEIWLQLLAWVGCHWLAIHKNAVGQCQSSAQQSVDQKLKATKILTGDLQRLSSNYILQLHRARSDHACSCWIPQISLGHSLPRILAFLCSSFQMEPDFPRGTYAFHFHPTTFSQKALTCDRFAKLCEQVKTRGGKSQPKEAVAMAFSQDNLPRFLPLYTGAREYARSVLLQNIMVPPARWQEALQPVCIF